MTENEGREPQDLPSMDEIALIASIIEARKGYEWLPSLTKYGTGSVVLVFDDGGFYVACKTTIKPLEERALKSFLKEVWRTLKAQGHPLLLPVSYVMVINGRPLIFMRYCEQSLREYMSKKGILMVDEALAIAVQAVKGLLYLREGGFIAHQDLKPENILLEDMRKRFRAEDIPPQLGYKVRIADFGLANALIEAGVLGGSNPYRASEQFPLYYKTKIGIEELQSGRSFDPDVFALGVIITEMITGKHPCGLSSNEVVRAASDSRFWERWSIEGERLVEIKDEELKGLVLKMLDPRPSKRPTLEEVYKELMKVLRRVNPDICETLETWLAFWDEIAMNYKRTLSDIDTLEQALKLSKVPGALDLTKEFAEYLRQRIKEIQPPKSPKEVHDYAKLCRSLGEALRVIDKEKYKKEITELGLSCIDLVSRWRCEIKAEHTPFKKITDYEACGLVMGYALDLLRMVLTEQEIESIMSNRYDEYVKSLYWFDRASNAVDKVDYKQALQDIEEALKYSPQNTTLLYFRALWKYRWALAMEMKARALLKEALNELRELHALEPTWGEVKRTLEEVEAEYYRLKRLSS